MPQHDIIDNSSVHLLDEVKRALVNSSSAHLALGYFFISGFGAIAREVRHLKKLRLLIGNTTNRETLEQMVEGYNRLQNAQHQQRAERMNAGQRAAQVEDTKGHAAAAVELMTQSDEEQEGALALLEGIESGQIEVRVYTRGRLHAKAYIFDFADQFHSGTGIIGSSNLSMGGLTHNTELNANLAGDANHAELTRWFNGLWEEAEPFNADLIEVLRRGWVANDSIDPYDIYIRTLYTLVKDRLVERDDDRLLWETEMPPLANYQEVAVEQARRILKDRGGVFIADVVGLGKTFIGLALLKHWNIHENAYGVVISPASLVPMWEMYIARFRIWATVLSMGALSQKENARLLLEDPKYSNAGIVLLDESHNFRGRDSLRYQALELFTADRPTILLTATPRNTSAWDIYHQIKLWHPDDRTKLLDPPNPPNLKDFFEAVEPRRSGAASTNIRDLLDRILIRRTRKHVLSVYGELDESGRRFIRINDAPKYFPDRELDTVSYNIEATYGTYVYAALRDRMAQLRYARYNLYPFVLPQYRASGAYKNLQKAASTLRGLMRIMLFKRFESSVAAFRATVTRMCNTHEWFLKALEQGIIPAGDEAQSILHGSDRDDQVEFSDVEDDLREASKGYELEHFNAQALYEAVAADLELLRDLERLVAPLTPKLDDKLVVLQDMLRHGRNPHEDNRRLPGRLPTGKVLIFTQFSDTAAYLYENLREIVGEKYIRKVDSGTSDILEVVARFAPTANPTTRTSGGELRVLVATDVLSEGLNMQDGDHIINYDLHWNPVRLIQRVGRIDRLGSPHDCVHVYNFLPEAGVERELGLQERLSHRVQEIHDMIGEDAYILSRSEQLNEEAMYAIYKGDSLILEAEEDGTAPAFSLLEAEEIIRQLSQDDPEYLEYIQGLPNGVRTSTTESDPWAVYVLCEAYDASGATQYRRMYLLDRDGSPITNDTGEIVRRIQCEPHVRRSPLPSDYNAIVARVQREFEEEVNLRQSELTHSVGRLGLGRSYVLQEMQLFHSRTKNADTLQVVSRLAQLYSSAALPRRAHNELNALRSQQVKGNALVEQLMRIARDYGIQANVRAQNDEQSPLTIRVVCSEALG